MNVQTIQTPKFEYGDEVRVIKNIRNDGTYQSNIKGKILVRRGRTGYIRHAGYYQQDQIVYQVHFLDSNEIIGCRETELIRASEHWIPNDFEYGDKAILTVALTLAGERIANKGDTATVLAVTRDDDGIGYRVQIGEHDIDVPARALTIPENMPETVPAAE